MASHNKVNPCDVFMPSEKNRTNTVFCDVIKLNRSCSPQYFPRVIPASFTWYQKKYLNVYSKLCFFFWKKKFKKIIHSLASFLFMSIIVLGIALGKMKIHMHVTQPLSSGSIWGKIKSHIQVHYPCPVVIIHQVNKIIYLLQNSYKNLTSRKSEQVLFLFLSCRINLSTFKKTLYVGGTVIWYRQSA